jgi:hypothetical protein
MMVAAAIVAVVLGLAAIWRRRDQYQRLALAHGRSAHSAVATQAQFISDANRYDAAARSAPGRLAYELADRAILSRSMVSYWSRMAIYHEELRRKYEEAATKPWRLVSTDPPPPLNPLRP